MLNLMLFSGESNCYKIVKMIMERNYAPVIVFSFSKKDCEAYAMQMSKLDFNSSTSFHCLELTFINSSYLRLKQAFLTFKTAVVGCCTMY